MAHHVRSWTTSLEAAIPAFSPDTESASRPRSNAAPARASTSPRSVPSTTTFARTSTRRPVARSSSTAPLTRVPSFTTSTNRWRKRTRREGSAAAISLKMRSATWGSKWVLLTQPVLDGLRPAVVGVDPLRGTRARSPTAGGGCRRWPRRRPPRASPRATAWAPRRSCARRGGRSGARPRCRPFPRPRRGRRPRARPARERQERRPPGGGRRGREGSSCSWKPR